MSATPTSADRAVAVAPAGAARAGRGAALWLIPAALALGWAFWSTLAGLVREWRNNDDYSMGAFVVPIAAFVVWKRRRALARESLRPCWWGLAILVAAQVLRRIALLELYESLDRYAAILSAIGVVVTVLGWRIGRRLLWVFLFLFLMVPLPGRIHNRVAGPLQTISTLGADATLELLGVRVMRAGHDLTLNDKSSVTIAEACGGLRMLTAFVIVSGTLALLISRPAWQHVVLIGSSIPIGVACNVLRLVATALFFTVTTDNATRLFFHDVAGWAMMAPALLLLGGELWFMARVVEPDPQPDPSPSRGG